MAGKLAKAYHVIAAVALDAIGRASCINALPQVVAHITDAAGTAQTSERSA